MVPVTIKNEGGPTEPSISVQAIGADGSSFGSSIKLNPGESTEIYLKSDLSLVVEEEPNESTGSNSNTQPTKIL